MKCAQELCEYWTGGGGCPCDVFELDEDERPIVREGEES